MRSFPICDWIIRRKEPQSNPFRIGGNNPVSRCMRRVEKSDPRRNTKDDEGPPSVTALPHRHGLRPGKPARAPLRSKSDERRRPPGARASRPHAVPLRAAQFPCDTAPGYPAGGNAMGSSEAESRPRCRSTRVERMGEALPALCGRDARVPGGLHPMTSSLQWRSIGLRVYSWVIFNNERQFLPPMIRPAGQGRHLQETPAAVVRDRSAGNSSRVRCDKGIAGSPIH